MDRTARVASAEAMEMVCAVLRPLFFVDVFGSVDVIQEAVKRMRGVHYEEGEVIVREGRPMNAMYVLQSGQLVVEHESVTHYSVVVVVVVVVIVVVVVVDCGCGWCCLWL